MNIDKAGIYKIVNKIDGKEYYGSASNSFKYRWERHKNQLNINKHHCKPLQYSWNKYGADNFEFIILEVVEYENLTKEAFKKILLDMEQTYLNQYWDNCKECYNVNKIAGNTLGYKHTVEARAKMSEKQRKKKVSAEARAKISRATSGKNNPNYGKLITDEQKQKISSVNTGNTYRLGIKHTQETRVKMSESHKGKIVSQETRDKLSKVAMGDKNPFFGKKHSDETKAKISAAKKKRKEKRVRNANVC